MTFRLPAGRRLPRTLRPVALLLALVAGSALASEGSGPPAGPPLTGDPALTGLVREALESRPEMAQARATVEADEARIPQARALPDPLLSLGIQNDGFRKLQIGEMETSWWAVTGAETFPWHGKRGLRADALTLGARQSEADLERVRLSVQAEVERAYVDLLLARDERELVAKLETLWAEAEGLARSRYEVGEGAQADVLRAQLERSRLAQRRWSLIAEERRRVVALNRAVGRPLDEPVLAARSLRDVPDPPLPDSALAEADAEARSPELRRARLAVQQSDKLVALAKRDYFPDITVTAGVMPRGGEFDPMWQAGLSFSIPIWAGRRQSHAVSESRARGAAASSAAEAVRRQMRQRIEERRALLDALLRTNQLYRTGILVQSEATVASTLAQYQVGRVPFLSVLEALRGYLDDLDSFYESVAAAQYVDIAQREVSLDPVAGPSAPGWGGASMPGAGSLREATSGRAGSSSSPSTVGASSTAMPRM